MQIAFAKRWGSRPKADVVAIPFWKDKAGAVLAADEAGLKVKPLPEAAREDFTGEQGKFCLLYQEGSQEPRMVLVGLGRPEEVSAEVLRTVYAGLANFCRDKKLQSLNVVLPDAPEVSDKDVSTAIVEGLYLTNYVYNTHHSAKRIARTSLLKRCTLIGCSSAEEASAREAATICASVYVVRDLINGNADDITPPFLAICAQGLAKKYKNLTVKVFDKKRIAKEGMGLLLAVSRGAVVEPRFIILEYRGNPKSKEKTVLVGKGVTFDTGGLQVKTSASMEHQRSDMGGAAVVLGTLQSIATLGLKVNVVGVIPSAENAIGSNSYKPGDIYKAYDGTSVEIGNTDAEGRLILADALAYATKNFRPTRVIDIATLTGAVSIALGDEMAGLWTNDDELADGLTAAGEHTYERVWRLPLVEEYQSQLKSDRADLKNVGSGSGGGSIVAALFLQAFVGETPWAHLDIAGVRYLNEAKRYRSKGATGFGVRLLVNYLKGLRG